MDPDEIGWLFVEATATLLVLAFLAFLFVMHRLRGLWRTIARTEDEVTRWLRSGRSRRASSSERAPPT